MQVRFYGFSLKAGDGISLTDFFARMLERSSSTNEIDFNGRKRLYLLEGGRDQRFYTGLFVTIKDHKKFCELLDEHGTLKIHVSEVDENANLMEFNFFIVNKETFCGLYQYYWSSCSIGQHIAFMRSMWDEMKEAKIESEVQDAVKNGARSENAARRKARKKYRKGLTHSLYYNPDDFERLIAKLSKVKTFEYELSTVDVPDDSFGPQNDGLKKITEKVAFTRAYTPAQIARQIGEYVKNRQIPAGRVIGEDADGNDLPIKLFDNPNPFGDFEFDDVAQHLDLNLDDFADSWVTTKLIEAADENPAMFVDDVYE